MIIDNKGELYLNKVYLAADVFNVCLQHAQTTEKQEIMGLLIGEVNEENHTSHIKACVILHRSDKQPDRVEISPEQLCMASIHAEELAVKLNCPMRVLGWYHSHPHITVWPSHVDIRTQATYQMMDPLFVGLIFSVYAAEPNSRSNQVQLTCFQATQNGTDYNRREVNIEIVDSDLHNYNISQITSLPKILIQEEIECHDMGDCSNDVLATLHNDAYKTQAIVHIVSKIATPLCDDLEERLKATNLRVEQLKNVLKELKSL